MTNGELQRLLAKLIFSTSDAGGYKIQQEFKNYDYAMKEYIYLKVMIVGYLCHQATNNADEAEYIFNGAVDCLSEVLNKLRNNVYVTYGCTTEELYSRIQYYFRNSNGNDLNSLVIPFMNCVGLTALSQNTIFATSLVHLAAEDLRNQLIKKTNRNTINATASSGCLLPVAASIALLSLIVIL